MNFRSDSCPGSSQWGSFAHATAFHLESMNQDEVVNEDPSYNEGAGDDVYDHLEKQNLETRGTTVEESQNTTLPFVEEEADTNHQTSNTSQQYPPNELQQTVFTPFTNTFFQSTVFNNEEIPPFYEENGDGDDSLSSLQQDLDEMEEWKVYTGQDKEPSDGHTLLHSDFQQK
jgi:hypothetical protein